MLPAGFSLLRRWGLPWFPKQDADDIIQRVQWESPTVRIYGRACPIPRQTAWYGDRAYSYSGHTNTPAPMPPWLDFVRATVERETASLCGGSFNSALLNLYRTGQDSVAWHADDEPELGSQPVIASLSIGAERKFSIKNRTTGGRVDLQLGHGDLLLMYGRSQLDYLHCLPKTARAVGQRVNITFRHVVK